MPTLRWTYAEYQAAGSIPGGQTVILADTGAILGGLSAAEIAGLAASGVAGLDATDDSLTLTVAQAQALGSMTLTAADRVLLGDSAATVSALSAAQLAALAGAGLDGIEATHGSLTLDAGQVAALGSLRLVIDYAGWLAGTALAGAAPGYALEVVGAPASAAAALQADPAISAFRVRDGSAEIGAGFATLAAAGKLAAIELADSGAISLGYGLYAVSGSTLAKLPSAYALAITDVPPAKAGAVQTDAHVGGFTVSGGGAAVATAFDSLASAAKLTAITLTDSEPLAITYGQLAANPNLLVLLPSDYALTVSGAAVSLAASLEADDHVTGFAISDSAVHVATGLASLGSLSKLTAIGLTGGAALSLGYTEWVGSLATLGLLTGGATIAVTGVAVADAAAVQASGQATSFSLSDTTQNVIAGLDSLAAAGKLTAIDLSDNLPIALSYAQYSSAGGILALLPAGHEISVAAVPASAAAAVQADTAIGGFTVADSAANLAATLDTLAASGKLTGITLTDGDPLVITGAQYQADAAARALLPGNAALLVGSASTAQAALLQADAHVAGFTVSDTAAHIAGAWDALKAAGKLTGITLSGGATLTLTEAQFASPGALFGLLPDDYQLLLTGLAATTGADAEADSHVTGFSVADTAGNLAAAIDQLAGYSKLGGIVLSGGGPLVIGFDQLTSAAAALARLDPAIAVAVDGISVSQLATVQADARVAQLRVFDNVANIVTGLAELGSAGKLTAITPADDQPLVLTHAQYLSASAVLGKLPGAATVTVADAPATGAAALQADAAIDSFEVSDTAAHIAAALAALNGETKLTGLHLLDSFLLPVTYAQSSSAATALALLLDGAQIAITDAPVSALAEAEANAAVGNLVVRDTAAHIAGAFDTLNAATKVSAIEFTDGAPLLLSRTQILDGGHAFGLFTSNPVLAVRADAATLDFTGQQISELADHGVQTLVGPSGSLTLNLEQYLALGPIALTGTDSVVLADTGAHFALLSAAQVAGLAAAGVDRIDTTDNILGLTVEQHAALGGVALTGNDLVMLADAGSNIAALTPTQISHLAAQGIEAIDATDDAITLSLGQYNARGSVALAAGDTVTLADTADYLADINLATLPAVDRVVVYDSPGTQRIYGTYGDDAYYASSQADVITDPVNGGNDTIIASIGYYLPANVETLVLAIGAGPVFGVGNASDNSLVGNEDANVLPGWGGNDTIYSDDGADALHGMAGNDSLNGGAGSDALFGGDGGDTLDGGADRDLLYGEAGDDSLAGGPGFASDLLFGGNGNDTIDATSGLGDTDYLHGGTGDDTYYIDTPSDMVVELVGEGTDTVVANFSSTSYYLGDQIENLVLLGATLYAAGNALANVITGSGSGNWLLGGAGDDTLNGKGGADMLFGQAGADTFVFERGTGSDTIGDFLSGTDHIRLVGLGFSSFAQVQAAMTVAGGSTTIALGQGDAILVNGVTSFTAGDFIFA